MKELTQTELENLDYNLNTMMKNRNLNPLFETTAKTEDFFQDVIKAVELYLNHAEEMQEVEE